MSKSVALYAEHPVKGRVPLKVDSTKNGLVVIDFSDYMAHAGKGFFINRSEALANTEEVDIRIVTPNTVDIYMTVYATSLLAATFKLWEATTKTHNGSNAITPSNKKRNSSNASDLIQVCHTAGGSQSGTPLISIAAAQIAQGSPLVKKLCLKANTAYLIEVVSGINSNICTLTLDWAEDIDYEESSLSSSSESSESSTSSVSSVSSVSSSSESSESSESSISSESSESSESL
jgi:hypothetical protein